VSPDASTSPAPVLATARLALRRLTVGDAAFIVELVNDPAWLKFIGDKGVRTPDDARNYLATGPIAMYAKHGFGLWRVERTLDGAPVGICGLIKRDSLADVDLGFAFLPAHRGAGYALESARATIEYGRATLGLGRIVAIVTPDNHRSVALLEKAGFRFERALDAAGHAGTNLYVHDG
jgi:[ribosomal protein S5]-alanine N-acetyltransferase